MESEALVFRGSYAMGSHISTRDISARDATFRDSVPENYSITGLDYRSIFAICVYAIHAQPSFLHPRKARVLTRNRIFSSRVASSGPYRELSYQGSPRNAVIEDNFARPICAEIQNRKICPRKADVDYS